MAYWNEETDAGNYQGSRVIQDFGGFGHSSEDFVINNGPFANLTLQIGPGSDNQPHLLSRYVNERQARSSSSWYVQGVKNQKDFATFKDLLYDTLHVAGHNGVGGGWGDVSLLTRYCRFSTLIPFYLDVERPQLPQRSYLLDAPHLLRYGKIFFHRYRLI